MAEHKIDGNDGAGNVDLIRRIDAMQACQVAPSDEWSKATKDGYNQAATDCAAAILRVAPVPAANDEVASYKMAAMECELECKALRAQRDDAWGRADHALALAADVIDRDIKKIQPEMTRRGQRLADGKKPGFQYAIHRADLDARISCRDKILALRDKPAPAVSPLLPDMADAATAAGIVVWWDNEAQKIKMAVTVQEAAKVLLDAFMRKDIDPLDAVDPQIEALAIKHSGNRGDPVIQLEIAEEFFCAALRSIAPPEA